MKKHMVGWGQAAFKSYWIALVDYACSIEPGLKSLEASKNHFLNGAGLFEVDSCEVSAPSVHKGDVEAHLKTWMESCAEPVFVTHPGAVDVVGVSTGIVPLQYFPFVEIGISRYRWGIATIISSLHPT